MKISNDNKVYISKKTKIFAIAIYCFLLSIFLIYLLSFLNFEFSEIFVLTNLKYIGFEIKKLLYEKYLLFSFIYIIFFIIYVTVIPLPFPAIIITSVIFNPVIATLISTTCISIGSLIFFYFLNLGFMPKFKFSSFKNSKILKNIKKKELLSILIFRLFGGGGLPFLAQNLVLYYSKVKYRNYFIGTIVGTLPGNFLLTVLGISIFTGIKIMLFN